MFLDKFWWQCVKLWKFVTNRAIVVTKELASIHKYHPKKIKGIKRFFLGWKAAITIGGHGELKRT